MIEINLAPVVRRREEFRIGGLRALWSGRPNEHRRQIGPQLGVACLGSILICGSLVAHHRLAGRAAMLEEQVAAAVADSIDHAVTIGMVTASAARREMIARRAEIIRRVDARRYVWPHLLQEISLSIPGNTWIDQISSIETTDSVQPGPIITLHGSTTSTEGLTRFMKNLEASPYVQDVTLIATERREIEGRSLQRFSVQARYEEVDTTMIVAQPIL